MIEKFGVSEDPQPKTATDSKPTCPRCGSEVTHHGNVRLCPQCGSAPFEPASADRPADTVDGD